MKIIVTAPGSLGDVNPLLAIARGLHAAGREVIFLAAERYLPLAKRSGLTTYPLVSEEQFSRLASDPRLWHPRHGARLMLSEAVDQFLISHYRWLEQNCRPGEMVLLSHVLDFAGRIYRDRYPATRFISVLPAPALLRSPSDPPRLSGYFWEPWIPTALVPLGYRCADIWIDSIAARSINRFRRQLDLPPVRRLLHRWWWSPDLTLGLFPQWYSVANAQLPGPLELVGFPLADSCDVMGETVAQELAEALEQTAVARPIVFAPGTAHQHAARFLNSASEACRQLDCAGVLLSSDPTQFPAQLPPRVTTASYLPFSRLLPRAAAIVHHGGIGTTSQALQAGIPQVVLPMAFDQFDNAQRVARLGCGSWRPMERQSTASLVAHLKNLSISSPQVAAVAAGMQPGQVVIRRAVDLICG